MTSSNTFEIFNVRFTGKNYSSWEFQFQLFVTGKGLWGHIDGSTSTPSDLTELISWKVKDAQVMTWILGSVDPLIIPNLRPYKTAQSMWEYIKQVYNRDNHARRFQLEHDIANYSQGQLNVQEYFSGFQNLWTDLTDIIYAKVPVETLPVIQDIHDQSKRDQFLMKLRPEFETLRAALMSRVPTPSLDACFGELLREEQRLLTQSNFNSTVAAPVAFATSGTNRGRDIRRVQCFNCKDFGHMAYNCRKKYCNYCRQQGHFLRNCPARPAQRRPQFNDNRYIAAPAVATVATDQPTLTPALVQDMILSALSALQLQGTGRSSSAVWLVDSGASNHMTNSSSTLTNVRTYKGSTEIQVADGSKLPITMTGDLTTFLRDIFISPKLNTNLISVGQLVDNNYNVHFSRAGCCVQDQETGTVLAKGPKVGRLFPISFYFPSTSSLSYSAITCKRSLWHKRLGHPSSLILNHLSNTGMFDNKSRFSTTSYDCSTCKLAKSKTLPFPTMGSRAVSCFEIVHSDVWGITPVVSHNKYQYFVSFIDDYSRYTWIYFLRSKSEVFSCFKNFLSYVKTQFSTCVKTLRTDSGGEYMSNEFHQFLNEQGILSQRSCPYTPQQNGVAERKNQHLLNVTRALLLESSVPTSFWVEALSTAVYLINRLPSRVLHLVSPYFKLYAQHPTYEHLNPF